MSKRAGAAPVNSGPAATTLVTGGAGYVGAVVVDELLATGRRVRVLDALIHDQSSVASSLSERGADVMRGDLRELDARRASLEGVDAVVHLAAIVGDPACARDPETSYRGQRRGDARARRRRRGRGRRAVRLRIDVLELRSHGEPDGSDRRRRRAQARIAVRRAEGPDRANAPLRRPRTRQPDVPSLRDRLRRGAAHALRPHGERVHAGPLGRAATRGVRRAVLAAVRPRPRRSARGRDGARRTADTAAKGVFNVGRTDENYRKIEIVEEIRRQLGRGDVEYVHREEDPRDYKVSFERIQHVLGFETTMTVPAGIAELVAALEAEHFGDPFEPRYRNTP